ncbi:MAG: hypothetical protein WCT10_05990 [Patescibacteria group bacterium]|jgi:hypothetical protein
MPASKHGFFAAVGCALFLALPTAAQAELPKLLDLDLSVGLGGPAGLIGASYPSDISTEPFTLVLAGRAGLPDYTPLKLELNAVIPNGFGANLRLDAVRVGRVIVHFPDLGIFWNVFRPMTAPRIQRPLDLTLGGGVDIRVWKDLSAGAEYRWFLPNPITVLPDYNSFAYPAYSEAARGGQLWLNVSHSW